MMVGRAYPATFIDGRRFETAIDQLTFAGQREWRRRWTGSPDLRKLKKLILQTAWPYLQEVFEAGIEVGAHPFRCATCGRDSVDETEHLGHTCKEINNDALY